VRKTNRSKLALLFPFLTFSHLSLLSLDPSTNHFRNYINQNLTQNNITIPKSQNKLIDYHTQTWPYAEELYSKSSFLETVGTFLIHKLHFQFFFIFALSLFSNVIFFFFFVFCLGLEKLRWWISILCNFLIC